MHHKSWPLWESWKLIFGKDRACGGGAEQVNDAAAHMRPPAAAVSEVNENDYNNSLDDLEAEHTFPSSQPVGTQDTSIGGSGKQTSTTKSGSRNKRKVNGPDSALMEFLANLHHDTNSHLEVISARIGYEFDLGEARKVVFSHSPKSIGCVIS